MGTQHFTVNKNTSRHEQFIQITQTARKQVLTPWLARKLQWELTWAPPTPVWECSSTGRLKSSPTTRVTVHPLPMWHSPIPRGLLVTPQRTRSPSTQLTPSLTPSV